MIKPCKRCGSVERYKNSKGETQKCKNCQRAYSLHRVYIKKQKKKGIDITKEFCEFLLVSAFNRIKEINLKKGVSK